MGLYPKALEAVMAGLPWGPYSNAYIVDPINGDDDNDGKRWSKPLLTLEAAEDLCTTNQNDVVFIVGGPTALNPAVAIAWDKDYTHLVGLTGNLPGTGQRARIVATAAEAHTPVMTIAGDGCIFRNLQFNNEKAAGAASGSVIVTGLRNHFENVFFMNPSATDAASYALKVAGAENAFVRCSIGQATNARGAASYGLWICSPANTLKFIKCEFRSWCGAAGTHALVYIDADNAGECFGAQFEDCLFENVNGGADLAVAIDDNCATTDHRILLRGQCDVVGCTAVADPLTYVYAHDADDAVSGCLMIAVAES